MKQILFAVAFALFSMPVSAERTYSPAFYREMQKLGLEGEAFPFYKAPGLQGRLGIF